MRGGRLPQRPPSVAGSISTGNLSSRSRGVQCSEEAASEVGSPPTLHGNRDVYRPRVIFTIAQFPHSFFALSPLIGPRSGRRLRLATIPRSLTWQRCSGWSSASILFICLVLRPMAPRPATVMIWRETFDPTSAHHATATRHDLVSRLNWCFFVDDRYSSDISL